MKYNNIDFNKKTILITGDINDNALLKNLETNYKFDYIFYQVTISDTTANEQDLIIKINKGMRKRRSFEDILNKYSMEDSIIAYIPKIKKLFEEEIK